MLDPLCLSELFASVTASMYRASMRFPALLGASSIALLAGRHRFNTLCSESSTARFRCGSLHRLRPTLIATEPFLGVRPLAGHER
jgi:hypothetical protein